MLHVKKELRRAIRVGGDDHLLGGVRVTVEMRRSLRPTGMTRMHLEPASIERDEVVHLVQLMDLGAELFRQVEVVRRQLVLGVVAAADVAVAARDAAGAPRPDPAEVRIVGLDARAAEVDAHRGLVERFPSAHLDRDLLQVPIDVGRHVRVANDAEHPACLVDTRRQLVGPVGDARPSRRVEELLRRDIQGVGIDMRAAAHACAGEDEHVVQVLDPLDPVHLCRGQPQEVRQIPLGLRNVFVFPAPAGLHDADPVALLRGTERGNAATEARADDHHVVVEACHGSPFRTRLGFRIKRTRLMAATRCGSMKPHAFSRIYWTMVSGGRGVGWRGRAVRRSCSGAGEWVPDYWPLGIGPTSSLVIEFAAARRTSHFQISTARSTTIPAANAASRSASGRAVVCRTLWRKGT